MPNIKIMKMLKGGKVMIMTKRMRSKKK
jgi:hypothetical protein